MVVVVVVVVATGGGVVVVAPAGAVAVTAAAAVAAAAAIRTPVVVIVPWKKQAQRYLEIMPCCSGFPASSDFGYQRASACLEGHAYPLLQRLPAKAHTENGEAQSMYCTATRICPHRITAP